MNLTEGSYFKHSILILLVAGIMLRVLHLFFIDMSLPFWYGGLFIAFAEEISSGNYLLPKTIPFYGDGGTPFAYPPIGFYVEAVLIDLLPLSSFKMATLLPPFIAIAALLSFPVLAKTAGLSKKAQIGALAAYALLPSAFFAQVEGAGLAKALGSLSMIWLGVALIKAYREQTAKSYVLAGLAWAFCMGASPGSAYGSAPTVLLFLAAVAHRSGWSPLDLPYRRLFLMAGPLILATAPYLLTVVVLHGPDLFTESFLNQQGTTTLATTLSPDSDQGLLIGQLAVLGWQVFALLGMAWCLLQRKWLFPAWFSIIYILPQVGGWLSAAPLALVAGLGIGEVFWPFVKQFAAGFKYEGMRRAVAFATVAILLVIYVGHASALIADKVEAQDKEGITHNDIAAMKWAGEFLPQDANLVILSSEFVEEWAPQVTKRTVLTQTYGAEWKPDYYKRVINFYSKARSCQSWDCLYLAIKDAFGEKLVYTFLDIDVVNRLNSAGQPPSLVDESTVYTNEKIVISLLKSL